MRRAIKLCNKLLLELIVFLIIIYKKCISPFIPYACRFEPTCSVYMIEAIKEHGILKGLYLGIKRICRCNPWGGHGHDPVPKKKQKH